MDCEIGVQIDGGFQGCVEESWLRRVALQALVAEDVASSVELGLVIADEETVRRLNLDFRGQDESTDVLAFSLLPEPFEGEGVPFAAPPDGVLHLGEVIVSYPQAVRQAMEHQHPVEREVALLIIHGVLHLLGYDHDEPDQETRMRAREEKILKELEKDLLEL